MKSQTLSRRAVRVHAHQQRSILIVEDDPGLADVLSRRLTSQGYQTTVAASGAAGIELARSAQPSLILLDLRLPDIDGLSVCETLVDDQKTCEIPVIILTGMEQSDILRRARAAGCQYFLHKPYDPNALLVLIQQAISESESP